MKFQIILKAVAVHFSLLVAGQALAIPAQVVLIRHGEKPKQGNELNQQGCERAFLLPDFFKNNPIVNAYGGPAGFFAMAPKSQDSSVRAVQTLVPTVATFNLADDGIQQLQDPFGKGEGDALANEIGVNFFV